MLNKRILVLMFVVAFLLLVGCGPPPTVPNRVPIITSGPITTATVGEAYTYDVNATDPDGDTLTYSLATPAGMTISSATGVISWIPTSAQVGDNLVTVMVSDGALYITQSFTIVVEALPVVNQAPVITSTPVTTATVGVTYFYVVNATDPEGDTLTYSLITKPSGMAIGSSTGKITWTPSSIGSFGVTVMVSDGVLIDIQSFTIVVSGLPVVNQAPVITSTPVTTATVGVTYFYVVNATDPDGDTLTYSLTTYPSGMTISSATGVISWMPTTEGNFAVVVKVSDGVLSDTQGFTITVSELPVVNQAPVINSTPNLTATVGVTYVYDVNATDPDNDVLTYSLTTYPSGMTISSATGVISWMPIAEGNFAVVVNVSDGVFVVPQSFTIMVSAVPPTIVTLAAINGVIAPVTGATPVSTITETAQYTGAVTWSGTPVTFAAGTIYTATITLTPKAGFTLTGVAANFFTVAGATATNAVNSGIVTAVFPETAAAVIDIAAIPGVIAPVTDATPVTTIIETPQYTGSVEWNPEDDPFQLSEVYIATITLTPKTGYTLTGVIANFFTVFGATIVTNAADSGVVTAIFPETVGVQLTIANPTLTLSKPYDGNTTAAVTAGVLIGVVSPDVVTVTAVATYDTEDVGTGKTITVVYTLGGANAGDYIKPVDYAVTDGVITPAVINIAVIPGVEAPATGAIPVTTITETDQYTGTVTWAPANDPFLGSVIYTATITLTPKAGFTLTGVAANFFTVAGATATNSINQGVVTAVFVVTTPALTVVSAAFIDATNLVIVYSEAVTTVLGDYVPGAVVNGGAGAAATFTATAISGSGTDTITLTVAGSPVALVTLDTAVIAIAATVVSSTVPTNALVALLAQAVAAF